MNIKTLLVLSLVACPIYCQEKIRIAIIDTGINPYYTKYRCDPNLDKDFTGTSMQDNDMHGQLINNIITKDLDANKYCVINIKFYTKYSRKQDSLSALEYASTLKISYLNLSWGGDKYGQKEHDLLEAMLDKNVKIYVAAGNESKRLEKGCNYYPPCYNDLTLFVVGSVDENHRVTSKSNYGSVVKFWEVGQYFVNSDGKIYSGTSFSVPRAIWRSINHVR